MANPNHIAELGKGVVSWNAWRGEKLVRADLSNADLNHAELREANLEGADLRAAILSGADLSGASLRGADLREANLREALLMEADLRGADLGGASLVDAILNRADLSGMDLQGACLQGASLNSTHLANANLSGADLEFVRLKNTDLAGADLTGCRVHGASVWGAKLDGAKQQNLVITSENEPEITVDNIEVAQFVYLLLRNQNVRDVIDTIGKKGVLLLGRFTEGRIEILGRLRAKLREFGFVPIVFNFDKPQTKDFTETIQLLANLSHFVIVDITNPKSTPLELQATVPDNMIPFAPILQKGEDAFAMFRDLQNKFDWVLDVVVYPSPDRLIEVLEDEIVRPAEAKFNQLLERRANQLRIKNV
jgi:uncharacterized protein YjbI with pentapeptide repeats